MKTTGFVFVLMVMISCGAPADKNAQIAVSTVAPGAVEKTATSSIHDSMAEVERSMAFLVKEGGDATIDPVVRYQSTVEIAEIMEEPATLEVELIAHIAHLYGELGTAAEREAKITFLNAHKPDKRCVVKQGDFEYVMSYNSSMLALEKGRSYTIAWLPLQVTIGGSKPSYFLISAAVI